MHGSQISNTENLVNGVTLNDFRKAFDMINVNVDFLISKLMIKCYRFNETLITWMHSHLTGRYQCVEIKTVRHH